MEGGELRTNPELGSEGFVCPKFCGGGVALMKTGGALAGVLNMEGDGDPEAGPKTDGLGSVWGVSFGGGVKLN